MKSNAAFVRLKRYLRANIAHDSSSKECLVSITIRHSTKASQCSLSVPSTGVQESVAFTAFAVISLDFYLAFPYIFSHAPTFHSQEFQLIR